jgi:predicted helicase
VVPDLELISKGQCFPLVVYEPLKISEEESETAGLFDEISPSQDKSYGIRDGITDAGLKHFEQAYPGETITKEDVFYYIYGLLHSEDYKNRYADNLTKELPRIPCVEKASDFWAFSNAGRTLADLHIDYEQAELYPVQIDGGSLLLSSFNAQDYKVEQMRFAKGTNGQKYDKTRVIYNHKITISGIPLEAYHYIVNGKPALEWVMERQRVSEGDENGIVNDANRWAIETMDDPAYPLKLFQRVITLSLKTMEIVRALPRF